MQKQVKEKPQSPAKPKEESKIDFAFDKSNYIILLVGLVFILLGFILMTGGGSDDPNVFNEDMFNFRRITLAPILILIGYGIEIYAIMKKPADKTS
ncbi:MAG: DUF3098 domain-containing protein [Bacteroidales bacterium]|nr:DUF3098 domain-containing protein [Bacteroidales bacterium]MDZ4204373.1 DUF3098 domain-containing protein [Bacteroidales bacterium]